VTRVSTERSRQQILDPPLFRDESADGGCSAQFARLRARCGGERSPVSAGEKASPPPSGSDRPAVN